MTTTPPELQKRTEERMREAVPATALRLLACIAADGSIGAAARALGMSQPGVSAVIARMESVLGRRVVNRSRRGSELTAFGHVILDQASGLLEEEARYYAALASLTHAPRKHRVAASMTIAEYLIPLWIARGGTTELEMTVCNSTLVMEQVFAGTVKFGFVEGARVDERLEHREIGKDRLTVVVGAKHRIASRGRHLASVLELADNGLVVREPGSGTREFLEHEFARAGRELPDEVLELGSTSAIKSYLRNGDSIAMMSRLAVVDELREGTLIEVSVETGVVERTLQCVWRSHFTSVQEVETFLGALIRQERGHS